MSTVISAFERPSKAFYLALNSSRMLKTGFSRKTAVKSQKRGNCRRCHHFMGVRTRCTSKNCERTHNKTSDLTAHSKIHGSTT
jgi:hypothetical protein